MLRRRLLFFMLAAVVCHGASGGVVEWTAHLNAARAASQRGDNRSAVEALQQALKEAERFGEGDLRLPATHNELAAALQLQGNSRESGSQAISSLLLRERILGQEHPLVAESLTTLAQSVLAQGRYSEAERLTRRALEISEKALGSEHPNVVMLFNILASAYQAQGRHAESEPLIRHSLAIAEKVQGREHVNTAQILTSLARVRQALGHYAEAEALFVRSLAISEKRLTPQHTDVATILNHLALLHQASGRPASAEPLFLRALGISEKVLGPEHPNVATLQNNLASLYLQVERYQDAEPPLRRSLEILEKTLGPDHPDLAGTLNNLAKLHRIAKQTDDGLKAARRATKLLRSRFDNAASAEQRGLLAAQSAQSWGFEQHIALLASDPARARDGRIGPRSWAAQGSEAFSIAQLARASDTSGQISLMTARFAAGNDKLADVARRRQDLASRTLALDLLMDRQFSKPAAQRNREEERTIRDERRRIGEEIEDLDELLETDFHQYRELTTSHPLSLQSAQTRLGKNEALVVFLVAQEESYVWAVRRDNALFHRLPLNRRQLEVEVRKLRAQLDLGSVGDAESILRKPFDVAAAHELYRKLFAPVEEVIAGARDLLIVPDGALQSLPPGVLVTEPNPRPLAHVSEHASVAWLAKKFTITVLPSVASLRGLRGFARMVPGAEPFGGFGNPVLEGTAGEARGKSMAAFFSRGAVADVGEVRKAFAPLPETAEELRSIAATLGAPASGLHLGREATETKVKSADLSRYRVLAFATHGVMGGEFTGVSEPALVLTPPARGTELDDGLLTASEIAQLKLNAEWVVLSACNTAATDGTPGAEGFSGLAKAFFYAGARSILVSHWAVSSQAAQALTVRMFEETKKGASKAHALQLSMLALMQGKDNPYFAHPAMWAPFIVVGEGSSDWAEESTLTRAALSRGKIDLGSQVNVLKRSLVKIGYGTGIVLTTDGYIVSAADHVATQDPVTVRTADDREWPAKVIGVDRRTGLGLVRIQAPDLSPVRFGDPAKVAVGDPVVAIASRSAGGTRQASGAVIATDVDIPGEISSFFVTNVGNIDGPLFNARGEVIALNQMLRIDDPERAFAIPVTTTLKVVRELRMQGRVRRGRIGFVMEEVTIEIARKAGMEKPTGVLLKDLEKNSPAEKAGLLAGDIVLGIDGKPIGNFLELVRVVADLIPGRSAAVLVLRNGVRSYIPVVVGEQR